MISPEESGPKGRAGKQRRKRDGMGFDVICAGMALVDSIIRGFDPTPVSASGYRAESGSLNVGGEAVNAAMAAAKLGLKTGILCGLGKDAAGDMVRAALEKCGVDTGRIVPVEQTPVTTMFVRGDGTRRSVTNRAHRVALYPEKEPGLFTDAKALVLGSLFRAPFDDPERIHGMLLQARAAGQAVFADTKLPNFRVLGLEDLRESLPLMDFITPNEDEAKYFTGQERPEAMAEVFLGYGVKNVIIKLGAEGCYWKSAGESLRLPGYKVKAVDATGAGDNFLAGFVSEILRGKTIPEALRFANACGAVCATAVGAAAALRNREQVLAFMEERKD